MTTFFFLNRYFSANLTLLSFTALITDDLTDAILCAKKIVKETQGMNYWQGWKKHCEGKDLSEWKKGCEVS
uniref:Lysozyme n=1 Tax=Prolemur simus TaxID=1328070 RepID=A0A8C9DET3_PROSS